MAFKITPFYNLDNTPIHHVDMENDVLGKANNNGTIIINKNVKPSMLKEVIDHEMVHIDQMKRGDLDYNSTHVFWKGKYYPRSKMKEGDKNLPWEKEAYSNA